MGRRQTIDRDHVLEVAENIIAGQGASALTIDAVAKAAGISKGGVQSCFGTKEAMIAAMLRRWMEDDQRRFEDSAGAHPSPVDRIRAHITTTHLHDDASHARAAGLLAVLLQTPEHLDETRQWYRTRLADFDAADPQSRLSRLAFLATEGAFFLRFFGLMAMDRDQWDAVFADIQRLLPANE